MAGTSWAVQKINDTGLAVDTVNDASLNIFLYGPFLPFLFCPGGPLGGHPFPCFDLIPATS